MRLFVLPLLTLTLALPALAVDGVLEINQACAESTGCFAGDSPGFPVTIQDPGSYRLTGALVLTDVGLVRASRNMAPSRASQIAGRQILEQWTGWEVTVLAGKPLHPQRMRATGSASDFEGVVF